MIFEEMTFITPFSLNKVDKGFMQIVVNTYNILTMWLNLYADNWSAIV